MTRKLLQQALEVLQFAKDGNVGWTFLLPEAITAIEAALAEPVQNQFKPDYDTEAVLVEEMQRMAKQLAEMQDWEAVASDQAMTIALLRSEQTTVTCQIYGHVVGACVECNTHIEQGLYSELLFAVGKKNLNETRHQTALRYIRQAEICAVKQGKADHGIRDKT